MLKYQCFSSHVDASFWKELARRKLDEYCLSDAAVDIVGSYDVSRHGGKIGARMSVSADAFQVEIDTYANSGVRCRGVLRNFNTVEEFKAANRTKMLNDLGMEVLSDIISGKAIEDPSRLNPFLLVTFADLKKHVFVYWFAFPALVPSNNANFCGSIETTSEYFSDPEKQLPSVAEIVCKLGGGSRPAPAFVMRRNSETGEIDIFDLSILLDENPEDLKANFVIGILDPSSLPENPGWPIRNILLMIALRMKLNTFRILCYRDYPLDLKGMLTSEVMSTSLTLPNSIISKVLGWECNKKGKMGPRHVNLSKLMDSRMLADSAVDLNLKLMRWRMFVFKIEF
eukprot:GSMAST32.ASY1.ANO1.2362.1 assembled CDS